jgi:hypothetical protein
MRAMRLDVRSRPPRDWRRRVAAGVRGWRCKDGYKMKERAAGVSTSAWMTKGIVDMIEAVVLVIRNV